MACPPSGDRPVAATNGRLEGPKQRAAPLTGSRTRAASLADLDSELVRCRRIGCSLVVAYA